MWGASKHCASTAVLALCCLGPPLCAALGGQQCENATACSDDGTSLLALRTRGPGSTNDTGKALAPAGAAAREPWEHSLKTSCPDFGPSGIVIRQDGKDASSLTLPLHVPRGGKLEVFVCNYGNVKMLGDQVTLETLPPVVGSVGQGAHVDVLVINSFNAVVYGDLEIVPDGAAGAEAPPQRRRKPEEMPPQEVRRLWDELGGGRVEEVEEEVEEEEEASKEEVPPQEVGRLGGELGGGRVEEVEEEEVEEEEEALKEDTTNTSGRRAQRNAAADETPEEVLPQRGNVAPEDFWPPKAIIDVAQGDAGVEMPPEAVANLNRDFLAPAGQAERAAWRAARVARRSTNGTDEQDAHDARRELSRQRIRERRPRGHSPMNEIEASSLVPTLVHGPVGIGARISVLIQHSANVLIATAERNVTINGATLVAPALRVDTPLRRNQVSIALKDSSNVLSRHGSVQVVNKGVLVRPLVLTEEAPILDSHLSVVLFNVGTLHGTDVRVRGNSLLVEAAVTCGKVGRSSLTARVTSTANVNALPGGHVEIAGRSSLLSAVTDTSSIYSGSLIKVSSVDISNLLGNPRNVSMNDGSRLIVGVVGGKGEVMSSAIEVSLAHAANVWGDPQTVSLSRSGLISSVVDLRTSSSSSVKASLGDVANVRGDPQTVSLSSSNLITDVVFLRGSSSSSIEASLEHVANVQARDVVSLIDGAELIDNVVQVQVSRSWSSSIQVLLAHGANVEGHPTSVSLTNESRLIFRVFSVRGLTGSSNKVSLAHVANVPGNPQTVLLEDSELIFVIFAIVDNLSGRGWVSSSVDVQTHDICNVRAETLNISGDGHLLEFAVNTHSSDIEGHSSIHAALEHVANVDGKNILFSPEQSDDAGLLGSVIFAGNVENSVLLVNAVDACNVKAEALHALGSFADTVTLLKNAVYLSSLTGSSVVEAKVQHTLNFKGMRCNVAQFVGSLLSVDGSLGVSDSQVSITATDMGNAVAQLTDIVLGGRVKTVFSVANDIDSALVSISLVRTGNAASRDLELHEGALIAGILESRDGTIQNSNVKVRLVDSASIFLVGTLTFRDSTLLGPITDDNLAMAAIELTLKDMAVVKGRLHGVSTTSSMLCADFAMLLQVADFCNSCTLDTKPQLGY